MGDQIMVLMYYDTPTPTNKCMCYRERERVIWPVVCSWVRYRGTWRPCRCSRSTAGTFPRPSWAPRSQTMWNKIRCNVFFNETKKFKKKNIVLRAGATEPFYWPAQSPIWILKYICTKNSYIEINIFTNKVYSFCVKKRERKYPISI